MSLVIRPLPRMTHGKCDLCRTTQKLTAWDSNLGRPICDECKPYLDAAEKALVAQKLGHPDDLLVGRNP